MMMNIRLEGFVESILEDVVKLGIASNRTEAIRLMILNYNEHYGIRPVSKEVEMAALKRKIDSIDAEIAAGKRKLLSKEEALGEYAKHLK